MWCVNIDDAGPYWLVRINTQDHQFRAVTVDKAFGEAGIDFAVKELLSWTWPH